MKAFRLIVLLIALCSMLGSHSVAQEKKLQIAVIPKGTTHDFWKAIHAGAKKAAEEENVDIIWQGPEREDNRRMQIEVMQNFISRGVDAIVLAPLDEVALKRPVDAAVRRNIPVVIIDSDLKTDTYSSFVATDNREGGRIAARHLGKILGGKGKVIMLRYMEGSASTYNREEGFLEVMKEKYPDIELISTNQYGGATRESAFQAAQNLLNRFQEVDGIFCPNESSAFGMLRALETAGKTKEIKFVGFDASKALVTAIQEGEMAGLVAQNPFKMGYLGVKTAIKVVKGEEAPKRIDTGAILVTPENIDDPEVRKIIMMELEQWK